MKTNTFMAVALMALYAAFPVLAQTWTLTSESQDGWPSIASSADGTKLIAIDIGLYPGVYLSTNSGSTWRSNAVNNSLAWYCAASSADGNTLVAGEITGYQLHISTNAGTDWVPAPVSNLWISVAASADGTKLVAAGIGNGNGSGGPLFTSTNSGLQWLQNTSTTNTWACVASSADGSLLVAVAGSPGLGASHPGPILTSTNSGVTWTPALLPTNYWTSVACSADGTKLVAGSRTNTFYSTDSGLTWRTNSHPLYGVASVASSADGNRLAAAQQGNTALRTVYTSSNSGTTWISNSMPLSVQLFPTWRWAVASSADGKKLVAGLLPGNGIYTSYTPPSPQLNLAASNNSVTLAWTIPSTNLILQENSDLSSTNWPAVASAPVLNYTNLQYQVTLPPPAGNAFYRLINQ